MPSLVIETRRESVMYGKETPQRNLRAVSIVEALIGNVEM